MKVKSTVQTQNSGAADAIEYLKTDGNANFPNSNSRPTVKFITRIHLLLDIFNSETPFANFFKVQ